MGISAVGLIKDAAEGTDSTSYPQKDMIFFKNTQVAVRKSGIFAIDSPDRRLHGKVMRFSGSATNTIGKTSVTIGSSDPSPYKRSVITSRALSCATKAAFRWAIARIGHCGTQTDANSLCSTAARPRIRWVPCDSSGTMEGNIFGTSGMRRLFNFKAGTAMLAQRL